MRCLVTGGAGFIGSHLVDALVARGHSVIVLDNLSAGSLANLQGSLNSIDLHHGDVTDLNCVAAAAHDVDCLFHLAALPSVPRSVADPLATHTACTTGTITALQAARFAGVRRFVYASSSSVYGGADGASCVEDQPLQPRSPYAAAKLAGERYCRAFSASYGLETACLRFFNVYGPRQRADSPYSGVIARFIRTLLNHQAPVIYGDGLQGRDFTYVADAVQAVLLAAHVSGATGGVYNVGAGHCITLLQLLAELQRLLGITQSARHEPARPGDVRRSQADIGRARRDLGYQPRFSLSDGLQRAIANQRAAFAECAVWQTPGAAQSF